MFGKGDKWKLSSAEFGVVTLAVILYIGWKFFTLYLFKWKKFSETQNLTQHN